MPTIPEALAEAVGCHSAGQLQRAEQIYRQILAVDSNNADALHLLGVIAHQTGNSTVAADLIYRAIQSNPNVAAFYNNLGAVQLALRKVDQAVACFDRALALQEDFIDAHHYRGLALKEQGKPHEAIASYRRALAIKPDLSDAHNNLGIALWEVGNLPDAAASFRRAVELKPTFAEAQTNLGLLLRQQGQIDEAIASFRRAMDAKPDYFAAANSLANALMDQGKLGEAEACFRQTLLLNASFPDAHNGLGTALQARGKMEDAKACYRRALEIKPNYAEAINNLGSLLLVQGNRQEAETCFRQTLQLKPDFAAAHNGLGALLLAQGKLEEAKECYRAAVKFNPLFAEAYHNLGRVCKDQQKLDDAVACFRRAAELRPDHFEAQHSYASALKDQGKAEEALACYRRAVEFNPKYAPAHVLLGISLYELAHPDQAEACFRMAIQLKPDYAEAHNNLGVALKGLKKFEDALICFGRALDLKPDLLDTPLSRSLLLLLRGNLMAGWAGYENRWLTDPSSKRDFCQPLWEGDRLNGKTILLHAEQGLGDTIQFVRYVPLVKQSGGRVIVECQPTLMKLLATCPGIDQLVARGDALPEFDVHAPLLSLPGILGTTLDTIPADVPYVFPAPDLVEHWRERLGSREGFKVGIAWKGNPSFRGDPARSIPLRQFAPLTEVPGVRWISLQKGAGREQLDEFRERWQVVDLADDLHDFMDTAAVLKNLDLLISCDTAVVHLAGALGVPVWLPIPFVPDWRWLLDRSDSPWYPTIRLFRQPKLRDWEGTFQQIQAALRKRLEAGGK